jgi:hypothetical protein
MFGWKPHAPGTARSPTADLPGSFIMKRSELNGTAMTRHAFTSSSWHGTLTLAIANIEIEPL